MQLKFRANLGHDLADEFLRQFGQNKDRALANNSFGNLVRIVARFGLASLDLADWSLEELDIK